MSSEDSLFNGACLSDEDVFVSGQTYCDCNGNADCAIDMDLKPCPELQYSIKSDGEGTVWTK